MTKTDRMLATINFDEFDMPEFDGISGSLPESCPPSESELSEVGDAKHALGVDGELPGGDADQPGPGANSQPGDSVNLVTCHWAS